MLQYMLDYYSSIFIDFPLLNMDSIFFNQKKPKLVESSETLSFSLDKFQLWCFWCLLKIYQSI